MNGEPIRIGKRGTVVIPASLRRAYRLTEGSIVLAEPAEGGILLRPAAVLPVKVYTPERKAEFLLDNAVTPEDYAWALEEVKKLCVDPALIPHERPEA